LTRVQPTEDRRRELRADCSRCVGLCCVAPAFSASADFAITKPAGHPCPNLTREFRCRIHEDLRSRGFPGCTVFDCFGAGQKVAQVTYGGRDWRSHPTTAAQMFDVFAVMRQLHELLWYLTEARERSIGVTAPDRAGRGSYADRLGRAFEEIEQMTRRGPDALLDFDVTALRESVTPLLRAVSERVRAGSRGANVDRSGDDLVGANLQRADLSGVSLRGALLIGADLRRADLRIADLIGADLRGANLAGANLAGALFLTQSQIDAAGGDDSTRLPETLHRPTHWRTT